MSALDPVSTAEGWARSTRVVEFRESLRGLLRPADLGPPAPDRLECAVAAENVLVTVDDVDTLSGCVLEDLRIAIDVGAEAADGGLVGVVRSGVVTVEGLPPLAVEHGEFELFPRVLGDARRMRYRLWLRDPGGARWFLRGTKLVVNEAGGGLVRRVWTETTTLYVVLAQLPDGSPGIDFPGAHSPGADSPGTDPPPAAPSYAGVVRVRPLDFLRQLASLHGEPGPAGGLRAVGRLASAFWSVVAEVYLRGGSDFAPGIEVAFGPPLPQQDQAPDL